MPNKEINEKDFDPGMFLPGAIWESKKSHTKVMVICATNLKTTEAMAKEYQPSVVSWDGHTFYSCSFERFLKVRQYVGQNKDFHSKFLTMVNEPIEPKEELHLDGLFNPLGTFFDALNNAQSIQSESPKAEEQKSTETKTEVKAEIKSEPKPYTVEANPEAFAVTSAETKRVHQRNSDYSLTFVGEDLSKDESYLLSRTAYSLETYRSPDSLSYVHAIKFDAQEDRKALFKALSKAQLIDTVSVSYLKEKVATIESSGVLSISTGVEDSGFFYKLELFEEGEADEEDSAEDDFTESDSAETDQKVQVPQVELMVSTENMLAETHGVSDFVEAVGQKESQGLIDKVKGFFK